MVLHVDKSPKCFTSVLVIVLLSYHYAFLLIMGANRIADNTGGGKSFSATHFQAYKRPILPGMLHPFYAVFLLPGRENLGDNLSSRHGSFFISGFQFTSWRNSIVLARAMNARLLCALIIFGGCYLLASLTTQLIGPLIENLIWDPDLRPTN